AEAPPAVSQEPGRAALSGSDAKQHDSTPQVAVSGSEAESEPEPPTVQVPRVPVAPSAEQREQWRAALQTVRQKLATSGSPPVAAESSNPTPSEEQSSAATPTEAAPEPLSQTQTARPGELAVPNQDDRPTPTAAAAAFSDAPEVRDALDSAQNAQGTSESSGQSQTMQAQPPTPDGVPAASLPPQGPVPTEAEAGGAPGRIRPLRIALGAALIAAVFALGALVGSSSKSSDDSLQPAPARRVSAVPPRAPEEQAPGKTSTKAESGALDPALDPATLERLSRLSPAERTAAQATALGRHWLYEWREQFTHFCEALRKNPGLLEEADTRRKVYEYVNDRSTSVKTLELLAALNTARALDIVYETWTGARERTDTTRLAEALLLASDVRSRLSPALSLAMALRDKPTSCETIRQLVQDAIANGDRRSSMLLVKMGARRDCSDGQEQKECGKCVEEPKQLRNAIRLSAGREAPPL
ncbi:MAG: hypothetical protein JW940_16210, partial [Polyangiaceae bacterium]|nr:hypothetical protein [Polyangiaceae bacterium]